MKVTAFLRNDHETLRSLFAKYKKSAARNQNGNKELFEEIRREILLHSQVELEIFYPALEGSTSGKAGELVSAAENEHRAMEKLLESINPQDRNFETKMAELIEAVNTHIEKEEEEIFAEARTTLPEYRLEELGLEVAERRRIAGNIAA